jgi:hypothetical protein
MSAPNAPIIASIDQASGTIVVGIAQNKVTGSNPVVQYQLFRAPTSGGPFSLLDSEPLSKVAIVTFAFDPAPILGVQQWYAAASVDAQGQTSGLSAAVSWSAFSSAGIPLPSNISAAAYGPYPLLGSDAFLSSYIGEGLVGPNGDLLTVNGLECLAQDLRIRLFTEVSELVLQPSFGFWRGKLIGSGSASSRAQAMYFETRLKACLAQEPRVSQVLSVTIRQNDYDSWSIAFVVMAIGAEDALRLNQVVPYGVLVTPAAAA